MAPPLTIRAEIAKDTINSSAAIVAKTNGASLESVFVDAQLPQLPRLSSQGRTDPSSSFPIPSSLHLISPPLRDSVVFPAFPPTKVSVVNSDAFTVARGLIDSSFNTPSFVPTSLSSSPGEQAPFVRTAVLNLASDELPGGGWNCTLSCTQEEALCYSSTLFNTLKPSYYPWPNIGRGSVAGVLSPAVVVFRADLDSGLVPLEQSDWKLVQVLTVAGPCCPPLSEDRQKFASDSVLEDLRGKIKLIYRMAAWSGCWDLVLGALGCGAYRCPPRLVAEEMKAILLEPEFRGWFRHIVFAVYSSNRNGPGNFGVFKDALDGIDV
ncbi:hypothetical protein SERLA73DRAFT_113884 [Serpula lacrymans var. lacrymans S7.3]|uniref:Microbial-type PARG catalytic domain-containing protein n=2 Tax=Serpula lacrymans var. lacrymans TaxID=341189 RepID=F8Q953_SERL3|nr:uncharacterized protein SERLADRAFT_476945 [Serpula lacrymans var. lacrymans S7.9]EGN95108.1 hypothetical protein SERLA73DRAFT_113884 [Serpula lacrymans var. lacrymans S7.3]EGO20595.1 hypothetical protein SERLADRAFT_476945 [Serpula lacrymans var. lacrymans S7.9]